MITAFVVPQLDKMLPYVLRDYRFEPLTMAPGRTIAVDIRLDSPAPISAADFVCEPLGAVSFEVQQRASAARLSITAVSSASCHVKVRAAAPGGPAFWLVVDSYLKHYGGKTRKDWLADIGNGDDSSKDMGNSKDSQQ